MKVLACKKPGQLEWEHDAAEPKVKSGYTLLKIIRIGICGTDLHAFEGTQPFFTYPRVLGHELAALIVESSDPSFRKGELVTILPYHNCGACPSCLQGKTNCCEKLNVFGVHVDGGMCEFLLVPTQLLVKVSGLQPDQVALIEPLAIAAHGVRRANVLPEEYVVVVGAGPIGLGLIQFATLRKAKVIVVDVNDERLAFCSNQFQVTQTIHAGKESVTDVLSEITNGHMASVVFDATGNHQALQNGFQYMGHAGRYVLVGLQLNSVSFSHPEFHKKEGTLMSSRNATREDFETVIQSMATGIINPLKMITHRVKFSEVPEQFEHWLNPKNKVVKVMVELD